MIDRVTDDELSLDPSSSVAGRTVAVPLPHKPQATAGELRHTSFSDYISPGTA